MFNIPFFSTSKTVLAVFFILNTAFVCAKEEVIVITTPEADTHQLTKEEIGDIFLARGHHDKTLTPYDREDIQLREKFYKEYTGYSLASVRGYWAKRVFTGRGRPPGIIHDDEIEQTLKQNPSAVTYIDGDPPSQPFKVLYPAETVKQP